MCAFGDDARSPALAIVLVARIAFPAREDGDEHRPTHRIAHRQRRQRRGLLWARGRCGARSRRWRRALTRVRAERGDARRGLYAYRHHAALLKVSAKGSLLDPFLVVVQAKTPVYEQRLGTLPAAQRLYLVRDCDSGQFSAVGASRVRRDGQLGGPGDNFSASCQQLSEISALVDSTMHTKSLA